MINFILAIIFWPIWTYSPNVANDFPMATYEILSYGLNKPFAWQFRTAVGFGERSLFVLWAWPVEFLYGFVSKIGFNFDSAQIILGFIPFILIGSYSINKLLEYLKLSYKARFAGSLFYLLNSYILLILDGGQINIAIVYALLPLVFLQILKSVNSNFYNKLVSGVLVSMLGFLDIRFLYILSILLSVKFLFDFIFNKARFFKWIYSALVILIIFLIFHFYWIWPVYNFGLSIPNNLASVSNVDFLSFAKIKHAILLLQPHWYLNSFGQIAATRKEFLLIPIIALLGIILNFKKKEIYFWGMISIVGIFLVKGSNPPFGEFYPWLFNNIPGFSIFRDPTKFYFLIALSYSVLIAYAINIINKKAPIFFGLVVFYLIFLANPVYTGKMTGLFSKPENVNSFQKIAEVLKEDESFGRVLWIPSYHKLGYSSLTHPIVEANRISSLRPFSIENFGTYETLNFLREGDHIAQLLNLSAIEYIAYPYPDTNKRELSDDEIEYYQIFSSQLTSLNWLDNIYSDENINLYKLNTDINKFFIAENKVGLYNSDEIYSQFSFDSEFNLNNNALIINNDYNNEFIYPSEELSESPNEEGWWSSGDFIWLRNFLQEKYNIDNHDLNYGGGYAITEQNSKLTVQSNEFNNFEDLYIRFLKSSKGGSIEIYQNNNLIQTIDTFIEDPEIITKKLTGYKEIDDKYFEYDKSNFEWIKIENFDPNFDLSIETQGDINIINALSTNMPDKNENNLIKGESGVKVEYKMIDPTEYILNISGVGKPSVLVFTETFDSNWMLDDQSPYKVYDLFNGFDIDHDGEYRLKFKPQKYLDQGFKVSLIGSALIILYIIGYEVRKNKKNPRN